jgi:hypothetical protein
MAFSAANEFVVPAPDRMAVYNRDSAPKIISSQYGVPGSSGASGFRVAVRVERG